MAPPGQVMASPAQVMAPPAQVMASPAQPVTPPVEVMASPAQPVAPAVVAVPASWPRLATVLTGSRTLILAFGSLLAGVTALGYQLMESF
jgi:hypothetical protein